MMVKKLNNLKWESVALEGFPASVTDNLKGFVGLEECTVYGMEREMKKSRKKNKEKNKSTNVEPTETEIPNKKIKLSNGFVVESCVNVIPSRTSDDKSKTNPKYKPKDNLENITKKTKANKPKLCENMSKTATELTPEDMLTWAEFKLPDEILKALMESGFKKPTKIQQLILPAAIHGRRDILGAAETGSGKTLAFGLPILSGIMKIKEKAAAKGLDVYEIPYKKTSVKKKQIQETIETIKRNGKKTKGIKSTTNKVSETKSKDSSEDGYATDNESNGSDDKVTNDDISKQENKDSDDFIEEIPLRKINNSADEGNESDDSSQYVHLSEMLDSDDLVDSGDSENDSDTNNILDGVDDEAETEESDENNEELNENEEIVQEGVGCVKVIDNVEIPGHVEMKTGKPLYALIITPTRELAIQISRHLTAAAKYTGIKIATVVGGMAGVKQERVLRNGPEVVVATPGRLWELVSQGQPHLQQLSTVKFLAIDETDRMVERGHFEELQPLLERLNSVDEMRNSRQNFVMSATLTLVHELPSHMRGKKVTKRGKILNRRIEKMTPEMKIKKLVAKIGMTDPKVVDITSQNLGTAETLTECRIACSFDQKDAYLYYILKQHSGRTIVFCNSIGCVKRLTQLFTILKCKPLPLHASMPQRQRLKNLERFRDDHHGVLVATDVAARGLDIPDIDHVIHYQVPRTAENYVHRSGRTARANKEGLTILMMEPSEAFLYMKLCRTLNKTSELPTFPVSPSILSSLKDLVSVGRELDGLQLRKRRDMQALGWRERAAKEMDMIIDEDDIPVKQVDPSLEKALQVKKRQLEKMLGRPMFPKGFSYKYPTLNESITTSRPDVNALQVMKEAIASNQLKKEKRKSKNAPMLTLEKQLRNKK